MQAVLPGGPGQPRADQRVREDWPPPPAHALSAECVAASRPAQRTVAVPVTAPDAAPTRASNQLAARVLAPSHSRGAAERGRQFSGPLPSRPLAEPATSNPASAAQPRSGTTGAAFRLLPAAASRPHCALGPDGFRRVPVGCRSACPSWKPHLRRGPAPWHERLAEHPGQAHAPLPNPAGTRGKALGTGPLVSCGHTVPHCCRQPALRPCVATQLQPRCRPIVACPSQDGIRHAILDILTELGRQSHRADAAESALSAAVDRLATKSRVAELESELAVRRPPPGSRMLLLRRAAFASRPRPLASSPRSCPRVRRSLRAARAGAAPCGPRFSFPPRRPFGPRHPPHAPCRRHAVGATRRVSAAGGSARPSERRRAERRRHWRPADPR